MLNATFSSVLRRVALPNISVRHGRSAQYSQDITPVNGDQLQAENKSSYINITKRILKFPHQYQVTRQVWVENFDEIKEKKKALVDLHPSVFGTMPRLDIISNNVRWQTLYRKVDKTHVKTRAECRGGGRKPWPQKGLGRARQGSIRAPQFIKGGTCHGPRNPTTHFFMLPFMYRVKGLTSTLSVKMAQDDLHVVDNLDIPTNDPQYILDLIAERCWGPSVLIVDNVDIMPRNLVMATQSVGHVNLMPVYGLNVYSMLKHDTLVLTLNAVNEIEERLLSALNSSNQRELHERRFWEYGV